MARRCCTCFNKERNLIPLREAFLLERICPEIIGVHSGGVSLCWECAAEVARLSRFRAKALEAHALFMRSMYTGRVKDKLMTRLSIAHPVRISVDPWILEDEAQYVDFKQEVLKEEEDSIKIEEDISDAKPYLIVVPEDTEDYEEHYWEQDTNTLKNVKQTVENNEQLLGENEYLTKANEEYVTGTIKDEEQILEDNEYVTVINEEFVTETLEDEEQISEDSDFGTVTNKEYVTEKCKGNEQISEDSEYVTVTNEKFTKTNDIPFNVNSNKLKEMNINGKIVAMYGYTVICTVKIVKENEMLALRNSMKNESWYKNAKVKCDGCLLRFTDETEFHKHHKKVHAGAIGNCLCDICKQTFRSETDMEKHRGIHYKSYWCAHCEYAAPCLRAIAAHYEQSHLDRGRDCLLCGATFLSDTEYRRHRATAHKKNTTCHFCGHQMETIKKLKEHIKLNHKASHSYECSLCHKIVKSASGLGAHMRIHSNTEAEWTYCIDCDVQFRTAQLYQAHIRNTLKHNPKETAKFKCEFCGKMFLNKFVLQKHTALVHLKPMNFKCHICEQAFSIKPYLTRHIRTAHEGLRPKKHLCELCGKDFVKKKTLEQHMGTHTGVRTCQCPECGEAFYLSGALYSHRRNKHNMKRLKDIKAEESDSIADGK